MTLEVVQEHHPEADTVRQDERERGYPETSGAKYGIEGHAAVVLSVP
jgi:hypothetical protein